MTTKAHLPLTIDGARDLLADLINRQRLPLPDLTVLSGRTLFARLADRGDIGPWSVALKSRITTGRESDGHGAVRRSLTLSISDALPGLWLSVFWESEWTRSASTVDPSVVEGYSIGGRR